MTDLISSLPDEIICYILSFLPSQQVVATSILSKRWNLLWRSVPSLDFDITLDFWSSIEENTNRFYSSVCSFLIGRGDQPFYRICLICYSSTDITESIKTRIQNAVSGSDRVQILDLYGLPKDFVIPSVVFSFKTLVTLKLDRITVEDMSFANLPLLKILHLKYIKSPIGIDLSQFLSGCLNLEELEVSGLACEAKGKFIILPKLVRVSIDKPLFPLEIFKDVEVLKFYYILQLNLNLNFDFDNLVQLQVIVELDWLPVLKVLNHCPKLQSLFICIDESYEQERVWLYPQNVPACISSHLRTCYLDYHGSKDEFQFAQYILENAKYLRFMKFYTSELEFDDDKKRELWSCKISDSCILSFK